MGHPARLIERPSFPYRVRLLEDPSQDELRRMAHAHTPGMMHSGCGNMNKISRNKARMARYTYVIAPDAERDNYSGKTMPRGRAQRYIERQRAFIEKRGELIAVNGYLGIGERACAVQWLYTPEAANIAGMQQVLAFPRSAVETPARRAQTFRPTLRVVYTPDCFAEGLPDRQAILVDLEQRTTYILGPDYFGESKKAALRMLNDLVYGEGGLVQAALDV